MSTEKQLVDAAIYRFERNTGALGKGFLGSLIGLKGQKEIMECTYFGTRQFSVQLSMPEIHGYIRRHSNLQL
jgi:hypothetical protein